MKNNPTNVAAVKSTAQDTLDAVEDTVLDSMDKARDATDKIANKATEAEEELHRKIQSTTETITEYIHEKPLQAAGIAFTAGVLATLLLSRNR